MISSRIGWDWSLPRFALSSVTIGLAIILGVILSEGHSQSRLSTILIVAGVVSFIVFASVLKGSDWVRRHAFEKWIWIVFFSLGIVFWEPAPFDLLIVLLGVSLLYRKAFSIDSKRSLTIFGTLCVLVYATQLVSLVDHPGGARFFAISVYLIMLSIVVFLVSALGMNYLRGMISGYVVGAILTTAVALFGFYGYMRLPVDVVYQGGGRLQGFFKDPNVIGPFLASALILAFVEFHRLRGLGRLSLGLVGIPVLASGIFLSYSRGAWVNCVVSLIVYFGLLAISGKKYFVRVLAGTILVMIVGVGLFPYVIQENSFFAQRAQEQSYDATRFEVQEKAFAAFSDAPLFGYGPGAADSQLQQSTHSLYLRVVYESGIVGALALTFLLLGAFYRASKTAFLAPTGPVRQVAMAVVAILAGILVNSVVVDTLHWRHLWIAIGLAWVLPLLVHDTDGPPLRDGRAGELA